MDSHPVAGGGSWRITHTNREHTNIANVTRGAKTTSNKTTKAAPAAAKSVDTVKGDADRLRETLDADRPADLDAVAYVGNTGHFYAEAPKPILDAARNVIGQDLGLYVDFRDVGITDKFYPSANPVHRKYVERMDAWLETGDPIIAQYNIRKLEPGQPEPPLAGWDNISASALAEIVAARLGDDHEANVEYVKECARYEREVGDDRTDVLAMLDGFLVTEAAGTDAFDATVILD